MIAIYDSQFEELFIARAKEMRSAFIDKGLIRLPCSAPAVIEQRTLPMRPQDHKIALRHIHEGAWTIGLEEEDLPGFYDDEE